MLMIMLSVKDLQKIKKLKKLVSKNIFTNDKNRIYTMCEATLQMLQMTVLEAEKAELTNEQFWIDFENAVNWWSVKDHNVIKEFEKAGQ